MTKLETLERPGLATVRVDVGADWSIALSGTVTTQEPDKSLGAYFRAVHDAAIAERVSQLTVDVSGLTFMNSSAIRLFIDWATWVSNAQGHRYKLCFVRNPRVTWQRVSFAALAHISKGDLIIRDAAA